MDRLHTVNELAPNVDVVAHTHLPNQLLTNSGSDSTPQGQVKVRVQVAVDKRIERL